MSILRQRRALRRDTFAEESLETVLSCLRTRNCQRLLPLETVEIMGDVPQRYLTFVVHPLDSSIAVMSMYSETRVLEMLGYALPSRGGVHPDHGG